jgi:hypothetical protein
MPSIPARTFAPDWGIAEEEASGSGAMRISSLLVKELEVHHGKGSVIYVKPLPNNFTAVGGRVVADHPRDIEL